MKLKRDTKVFVDVSPLWELQYTGISNVVHELAQRFLVDKDLTVEFMAMGRCVTRAVIAECVAARGGTALQEAVAKGKTSEVPVDAKGLVAGHRAVSLYTNTKPARRVFHQDSQIFYDFSPLLTPECHTPDTIRHHMFDLESQIASNSLAFCISESTAGDLHRIFGVERQRIRVSLLGNNVDTRFAERLRHDIGGQRVESFFLVLGTIEPRKNIAFILDWIKANPLLLSRHRFVFAGREGWGQSFAQLVADAGLNEAFESGRLTHLGYVDEWTKAALLVSAEALIFPSVFEGFGLPILEAMAVGTVVMASVSTSIPEVLGDTGYYFDPCNLDSMTRAYEQFMTDRRLSLLGLVRRRAQERAGGFSYDKTYRVITGGLADLMRKG